MRTRLDDFMITIVRILLATVYLFGLSAAMFYLYPPPVAYLPVLGVVRVDFSRFLLEVGTIAFAVWLLCVVDNLIVAGKKKTEPPTKLTHRQPD